MRQGVESLAAAHAISLEFALAFSDLIRQTEIWCVRLLAVCRKSYSPCHREDRTAARALDGWTAAHLPANYGPGLLVVREGVPMPSFIAKGC